MADQLREALHNQIHITRKEEGNLQLDLLGVENEPNAFMLYERWTSQHALDWHFDQTYTKDLLARFPALLEGSMQVWQTKAALPQSTQWTYDGSHAKISFTITHFGISETEGKFTKFSGMVLAGQPDFSDARVDLLIDVSSIDTNDPKRDEHLRSADFFDVAKYPSLTFKSNRLRALGNNKYELTGDLAIRGVTKEVTLMAEYRGTVVDPFKNTKAGFRVTGTIDRTAWGLTWNGKLAIGDMLVGHDVRLDINLELQKS